MKYYFLILLITGAIQIGYSQEEEEAPIMNEEMPVYPGCEDKADIEERQNCTQSSIYSFIQMKAGKVKTKKLKKPVVAYVGFILDTEGLVKEAKVLRSIPDYPELESAAIRIVEKLPQMKPATQQGVPVNIRYTIPVRFK